MKKRQSDHTNHHKKLGMTVRPELLPACQHRPNACHQSLALQMHIISPERSQTIIETHVLNRICACWCASWLKRSAALVHVHLPHLLALAPLYKMFSIAATPSYMTAASQTAPVSTPDRLQGPAACECHDNKRKQPLSCCSAGFHTGSQLSQSCTAD